MPGFLSAFRGLDFLTAASQVGARPVELQVCDGDDGDDLFLWKDGDWRFNMMCIIVSP